MTEIKSFSGKHRFLSNFAYMGGVTGTDGRHWPSVEHAFQACKTLDRAAQEHIRQCRTSGGAKRAGRAVQLRDDWEQIKDEKMLLIVRAKFTQNPELRQMLLDTGDAILIEGNNWGDTYWGQCNGVGQNKLGIILMQVREELK